MELHKKLLIVGVLRLMLKERKFLTEAEYAIDVDKRTIQGYYSRFSPDPIGDLTRQGTFTKTVKERGPRNTEKGIRSQIKMGFNHGEVCGIPIVMYEDAQGAYFEGKVDPTPLGDTILTRVDSGSLDSCSFEYKVMKADYPKNDKEVHRVILEAKLYEVGPVDYPMHEDAIITGRKSAECLGQLCDQLLYLIKTKSEDFSDVKELKELYSELTERLRVAEEQTLPEVKRQPGGMMILEQLKKFNQTWRT